MQTTVQTTSENSAYTGLNYITKSVNQNFRIKISGIDFDVKYNQLVGISGLINIIGVELANNLIDRAFNSGLDKTICKLRRGLKVTFYSK